MGQVSSALELYRTGLADGLQFNEPAAGDELVSVFSAADNGLQLQSAPSGPDPFTLQAANFGNAAGGLSGLAGGNPVAPFVFDATRAADDGDSNATSLNPVTSYNGRQVAFTSFASDLVADDTNGFPDVFVRDITTGETHRLNSPGYDPDLRVTGVSVNGEKVLFETSLSFSPKDTNGQRDVYLWNVADNTVTLLTFDPSGNATGVGYSPVGQSSTMTANGESVVFIDPDGMVTHLNVSSGYPIPIVSAYGGGASDGVFSDPSISSDGRYVVFASTATDLTATSVTNGRSNIFLLNLDTNVVTLVSAKPDGTQANGDSSQPSVSVFGDVAYKTMADNLANDTNGHVADIVTTTVNFDGTVGATRIVSVDENGNQWTSANETRNATISSDGKVVSAETDIDNDLHTETAIWDVSTVGLFGLLLYLIEGNGSSGTPSLSGSGNFCSLNSSSDDIATLGSADGNQTGDVYSCGGVRFLASHYYSCLDPTAFGSNVGECVYATNGADTVKGTAGNELIYLNGGNDIAFGLQGPDFIGGGNGNDALFGAAVAKGYDFGGSANRAGVPAQPDDDTLDGGAGNDTLFGAGGRDLLIGGGGNDSVVGGSGNDTANGNAGADSINAGSGNDNASGGGGNDTISGGGGSDVLKGDAGNDHMNGGGGNDTVNGGAGADSIVGSYGNDLLQGGDGNDDLRGGGGHDTLNGGKGDDKLSGGGETDTFVFSGAFGHDTITNFAASNQEKIDLSGIGAITGFQNLVAHHLIDDPDGSGFAAIKDGSSNTILIAGYTMDDFGAGHPISGADFIFA